MRVKSFLILALLIGVLLGLSVIGGDGVQEKLFAARDVNAQRIVTPRGPALGGETSTLYLFPFAPSFLFQTQPLSPSSCADLVVDGITFTPQTPQVGDEVDITVRIKNQGDETAPGFYVYLYLDPAARPPAADTPHVAHTYYGLPLLQGDIIEWTRTGQIFETPGSHVAYAWVDPTNLTQECDEANNLSGPASIPVSGVGDAYEPDDRCEQATPILTDGSVQQHTLAPAPDQDWVTFDATSGITYFIQAIPDSADAALAIEVYMNCNQISFRGGAQVAFTAWSDGPAYLKLLHASAERGQATAYQLNVSGQYDCSAYFEPNNVCAAAGEIAMGVPQTHTSCQRDDRDWVRFDADAGNPYVVSATDVGAKAKAELTVFMGCDVSASLGAGQQITVTPPISGTVYIQAKQVESDVFGTDTEYLLQVQRRAHTCDADAFEPDNSWQDASILPPNEPGHTHTICPAGDEDWARFEATPDTAYAIETLHLGDGADTVLCLYGTDGATQLECDEDSGPGDSSRIIWQPLVEGIYFVSVGDRDPEAADDDTYYDLHITTSLCHDCYSGLYLPAVVR